MEKKSFSKRLFDYVLCSHKELLFLGSVKGSQSGKETYIYICSNCGKVKKSTYRLDYPELHLSTKVISDKLEFVYKNKFSSIAKKYDINNFYKLMIESKIEYSREQFKADLIYLEEIIQSVYKEKNELIYKLRVSNNINEELKRQVKTLESIIENRDNIIYNEKQLSILKNNEVQLHNTENIKDWLLELLIERKVLIPRQAFNLFKKTLTALYGYEDMRNKWDYDNRTVDGIEYVEYKKREKRRISR